MGSCSSRTEKPKDDCAASSSLEPMSESNISKLHKLFPFKGYVAKVEHRGITIRQLKSVEDVAVKACDAKLWKDTAPPQYSKTSGLALEMSFLNLYHANTWIIMPATKKDNCSMVELLCTNKTGQIAQWFLSHWWGEAIRECVACLQEHMKHRGRSEDDSYWICAYANRQHDIGASGISADPKDTGFYRALALAKGVLILLDGKKEASGPSTTLSRIWCGFEDYVAATSDENFKAKLLIDIATVKAHDATPDIIVDGLSEEDKKTFPRLQVEKKLQREALFPMETLLVGLEFSVQTAQATVESDRIHILNAIAERPLSDIDLPPFDMHEGYEAVNETIRGAFAKAAFPHVMREGLLKNPKVLKIMKADQKRTIADLWLPGAMTDTEVSALADHLPPNLINLHMVLPESMSGDQGAEAMALNFARMQQLKTVIIDYSGPDTPDYKPKSKLTEVGAALLFEGFESLPSLKVAELNMAKNPVGPDFAERAAKALPKLSHLHTLKIDLNMTQVKGPALRPLFEALQHMSQLKMLQMRLNNIEVSDELLGLMGKQLQQLSNLEGVALWLWVNPITIAGARMLCQSLKLLADEHKTLKMVRIIMGATKVPESMQRVETMDKLVQMASGNV
mmetsp:Transcript_12011/g.26896  ORF Transcript_12011/g.26896 Transcript_12011/m.26896 type:complete len:624 (-) Transcript_12011:164-2035(-)